MVTVVQLGKFTKNYYTLKVSKFLCNYTSVKLFLEKEIHVDEYKAFYERTFYEYTFYDYKTYIQFIAKRK